MYSESHYACFGCQRALAPADPRRAPKKRWRGTIWSNPSLFHALPSGTKQPKASTVAFHQLHANPNPSTNPRSAAPSPPPVFGLYKDLVKMTAKKEEQMDEEDVQEAGRPTKQRGRPGNAVETAWKEPSAHGRAKAPFRDSFTAADPDWVKTLVSLWPPVRHLKVQVLRFEKRQKKRGALYSQTCGQSPFRRSLDKRTPFFSTWHRKELKVDENGRKYVNTRCP